MNEENITKKVEKKEEKVLIKPLKDFKFKCNEFKYDLKKGKEIKIEKRFLPNLKTEEVIK